MRRIFILTFLFCFSAVRPLAAAEIYLHNGDRITGELLHRNQDSYIVKTEAMGVISVFEKNVKQLLDPDIMLKDSIMDSEPETLEPKPEKKKIWSGEADLGADLQRGNKEAAELTAGFAVKRKTDKNEFDVAGHAYYSAEDKKMNAQKYDAMTRYAYSFGRDLKWYNFYKTEADHDRFANIDYRLIPTTGLGYWFYDLDDFKAMAEIGVGVEYTKYREDRDSEAEGILVPRIYLEKRLLGKSKISQDLTVYPSFTESGEYRLKSLTVLSAPLSDQVALKFTLLDEYNSKPGGTAKKNDLRLTSGLSYSF